MLPFPLGLQVVRKGQHLRQERTTNKHSRGPGQGSTMLTSPKKPSLVSSSFINCFLSSTSWTGCAPCSHPLTAIAPTTSSSDRSAEARQGGMEMCKKLSRLSGAWGSDLPKEKQSCSQLVLGKKYRSHSFRDLRLGQAIRFSTITGNIGCSPSVA